MGEKECQRGSGRRIKTGNLSIMATPFSTGVQSGNLETFTITESVTLATSCQTGVMLIPR